MTFSDFMEGFSFLFICDAICIMVDLIRIRRPNSRLQMCYLQWLGGDERRERIPALLRARRALDWVCMLLMIACAVFCWYYPVPGGITGLCICAARQPVKGLIHRVYTGQFVMKVPEFSD